MPDWEFVFNLVKEISKIGKKYRESPKLHEIEIFKNYFSEDGKLKEKELDELDGEFTRREILTRYLLLSVVLDQGPDPMGVGMLLKEVINQLYQQEIRILHRPIDFFEKLEISIDKILEKHESIKEIRAKEWAKETGSKSPKKYNLFFTQSLRGIVPNQVLDYAIHRWGVPLCVPLLLERDIKKKEEKSSSPLIDYLESYKSAERMAQGLKTHSRYGLGSAIGDKACHLFAKNYVSIFKLVRINKVKNKEGWTDISYELPFDSNAGRVLFRTGFLLEFATLEDYKNWKVIQEGKGKRKTDYIRVTNIRDKKIIVDPHIFSSYSDVRIKYLGFRVIEKKGKLIPIHHLPNLIIYKLSKENISSSVAEFDDGLMYIGTKYCFNHNSPNCKDCLIKELCRGYQKDNSLITQYTT